MHKTTDQQVESEILRCQKDPLGLNGDRRI